MKVLLLCNIIPAPVANAIGISQETAGGWVSSVISELENKDDFKLCICFPVGSGSQAIELQIAGIMYYGFKKEILNSSKYDFTVEKRLDTILKKENPDIVHIFGTEYPHTLAMVKVFNKPERTIIHIQGMVSVIARHYCGFLPTRVTRKNTFRDFLRHDNIVQQKKKFELRGEFEIEALKKTGHVMGRTDWDEACCKMINPSVKYHYVQEAMRPEFYEGQWSHADCRKHSIFMSQGSYPVKGLHLALEALKLLKKEYTDVKLYVAGPNIFFGNSIKQQLRKTYYAKYIMELIKKWNLENHVEFLGSLSAKKMKELYLASHVFISPSVIENSPNSIGEAMLLGVPIVASDVGGVTSILEHKREGLVYPADEPISMYYYIKSIFDDVQIADRLSEAARIRATKQYNKSSIIRDLLNTYENMLLS